MNLIVLLLHDSGLIQTEKMNKLNEIQSVILYRIINELINNTIKHAKTSQANIDLIIADENITLILKITE